MHIQQCLCNPHDLIGGIDHLIMSFGESSIIERNFVGVLAHQWITYRERLVLSSVSTHASMVAFTFAC